MLGAPVGENLRWRFAGRVKIYFSKLFSFSAALSEAKRDALRTLANHGGEKFFHFILASLKGD
jgi:hypothetical protein